MIAFELGAMKRASRQSREAATADMFQKNPARKPQLALRDIVSGKSSSTR
jgi:hypothetical protein